MKKRIIALAVSVLMLFSVMPTGILAEGTAQVAAENYTTSQGGYAYVYLRANNFVDVAVLDIEVFYDSSVMSVNYTSNGSMFSGASVSTNTSEAGVIKISAMSVNGFNSTGSTYSDRMMTLCFKVNATCPAGDYPIRVSLGHAYDSSFTPAEISGVNGTVTVKEAAAKPFTVNISKNMTSASLGAMPTLTVYPSNSYTFASADFHIEYDRELLRISSIVLDSSLQKEGMVHSVNSSNPGIAIISFASTNGVRPSNLFKVIFEVIADTDAKATVKVSASDVYTDELATYAPYTASTSLTLTKKEVLPDYPDMTLTADRLVVGEQSALTLTLEGTAQVAAGDFVINYDADAFAVNSVKAAAEALSRGALIIVNNSFTDGQIRFSYVNQAGSFDSDTVLLDISLTPITSPSEHCAISVSGSDVCDVSYNDAELDYIGICECIFDSSSCVDPTATTQGEHVYTCHSCGEQFSLCIGMIGDIDADGSFTNSDLCVMIRYLSGWNVDRQLAGEGWYYPAVFLDTNRDQKTNNRDAFYIIRKLADLTE